MNNNILETYQEGSVEQIWSRFKSTFINAINSCLSKKNIREKEWITKEVKEIIEKKSKLYLKILNLKQRGKSIPLSLKNNYNLVKKEAKNACRKALNDWWEKKAKKADLQAEQNIKNGRCGSILISLKITKQSKIKYVHGIIDADNKTKLIESLSKMKR